MWELPVCEKFASSCPSTHVLFGAAVCWNSSWIGWKNCTTSDPVCINRWNPTSIDFEDLNYPLPREARVQNKSVPRFSNAKEHNTNDERKEYDLVAFGGTWPLPLRSECYLYRDRQVSPTTGRWAADPATKNYSLADWLRKRDCVLSGSTYRRLACMYKAIYADNLGGGMANVGVRARHMKALKMLYFDRWNEMKLKCNPR